MRRAGFAVAIVLLIALNIWRWWPDSMPVKHAGDKAKSAAFSAQQLRLSVRVAADDAPPGVMRNIFQLREQPLPPPRPKKLAVQQPVVPVQAPVPEPPPKTPEQIEEEAARAELAQIKLVGVIFRNAKGQAYLSRGEQTYLVSLGDSVARFTVTAITAEGVKLHDVRTQVGGDIPVLGK